MAKPDRELTSRFHEGSELRSKSSYPSLSDRAQRIYIYIYIYICIYIYIYFFFFYLFIIFFNKFGYFGRVGGAVSGPGVAEGRRSEPGFGLLAVTASHLQWSKPKTVPEKHCRATFSTQKISKKIQKKCENCAFLTNH